jgi:hypothetical protein
MLFLRLWLVVAVGAVLEGIPAAEEEAVLYYIELRIPPERLLMQ